MKTRLATPALFIFLVLISVGTAALMTQDYLTKNSPGYEDEITELREALNETNVRLDHLTTIVEERLSPLRRSDEDVEIIPVEELFTDNIVRVGVIVSTKSSFQTYEPYVKEIIEKDVNTYADSLGSALSFEFDVRHADGQAAIHLETVQDMRAEGIRFILGGMWSSQACASLPYCNDNDVLLFSPSSTSPLPAIPEDNLFRLAPTDLRQAPVMASILRSMGVEAVVFIQRGDSWGDMIHDEFISLFNDSGGVILDRIRYPSESMEFTNYLEAAEKALAEAVEVYGMGKVAVQLVSFSEAVNIIQQAKDYPNLYNSTWYGSDGTVLLQQMSIDAPEESSRVKLYSTKPVIPESADTKAFLARYEAVTGTKCGFYTSVGYDIAMLLARSVIEAGSIDVEVVKDKIRVVSFDYQGVSGLCRLDEADDRHTCNYGVYGYKEVDGVTDSYLYGIYTDTGEMNWFDEPEEA